MKTKLKNQIHVRERLQKQARAEALRKKRNARSKSLNSFMKNPYGFAKKLFEQSKNDELKASQAEVEAHFAGVYGNKDDVCMDIPGLKWPAWSYAGCYQGTG